MIETIPYPLKILVVDDAKVNQRVLMKQMDLLGNKTVGASNGQMAIAACDEEFFDLIFMDCSMPVLNGYQATVAIRKAQQHLPKKSIIVGLTAHTMGGDRQACFDAGMDDYLSKPAYSKDLKAVIEKWFVTAEEIPSAEYKLSA